MINNIFVSICPYIYITNFLLKPTTNSIFLYVVFVMIIEAALKEFSRRRTVDAHAICDLAMYNYVEMRSKVMLYIHFIKMFRYILYILKVTAIV